jgi:hypothetical protein
MLAVFVELTTGALGVTPRQQLAPGQQDDWNQHDHPMALYVDVRLHLHSF